MRNCESQQIVYKANNVGLQILVSLGSKQLAPTAKFETLPTIHGGKSTALEQVFSFQNAVSHGCIQRTTYG
jgi:hypothetical protein